MFDDLYTFCYDVNGVNNINKHALKYREFIADIQRLTNILKALLVVENPSVYQIVKHSWSSNISLLRIALLLKYFDYEVTENWNIVSFIINRSNINYSAITGGQIPFKILDENEPPWSFRFVDDLSESKQDTVKEYFKIFDQCKKELTTDYSKKSMYYNEY